MKTNKLSASLFASLVLGSLALAGCNAQDHIQVTEPTTPPIAAHVGEDGMQVPTGIAVGFTVVPYHGDSKLDANKLVELRTDDATVMRVDPTPKSRRFVIYGVKEGQANVHVLYEGSEVLSIPVNITKQ